MNKPQQIAAIQAMARGGHMRWIQWLSVALCIVLLAQGLRTGQLPYFLWALVPALLACVAYQSAPHVRAASLALARGQPTPGWVDIAIEDTADTPRFHATVHAGPTGQWRLEFIPLGWQPAAGSVPATLYMLPDLPWPALIEVPQGLAYPRDTPQPVRT